MARKTPNVGVVIVAGGSGTRFGGRTPKQFLKLNKKSILEHSVERFASIPSVREIVVVIPAAFVKRPLVKDIQIRQRKISRITAGGETRQDSVWNGLMSFISPPKIVLVHDAVRPFVSRGVILKVIAEAGKHRAAVVGVPVRDTIKRETRKGFYGETVDRQALWAVQTPQGFETKLLVKAHVKAASKGFSGTDEASLVERMGCPVRIVRGSNLNMKITTPEDLELARVLAKRQLNPR